MTHCVKPCGHCQFEWRLATTLPLVEEVVLCTCTRSGTVSLAKDSHLQPALSFTNGDELIE